MHPSIHPSIHPSMRVCFPSVEIPRQVWVATPPTMFPLGGNPSRGVGGDSPTPARDPIGTNSHPPIPHTTTHARHAHAVPPSLKIRRKAAVSGHALITIIPVSITVGASGQILVTLKRDTSAPPYMILNRCRDIVIALRQRVHLENEEVERMLEQARTGTGSGEGSEDGFGEAKQA
eukprot:365386-Chlamydomonas_euryale.AAC.7